MLESLAVQFQSGQSPDERKRLEAKREQQIALCRRRIENAKLIFMDGDISREEYLRRKDDNERTIKMWEARTEETDKIVVELATCVEAVEKIASLWDSGDDEDQQMMAQNLFEYVVFDLDTHRITDFRLKEWADRFVGVRASMFAGDKNKNLSQSIGEGNHIPPTEFKHIGLPSLDVVATILTEQLYPQRTDAIAPISYKHDRNRKIVERYYQGETLSDLAREFDLSPQRVYQIANSA